MTSYVHAPRAARAPRPATAKQRDFVESLAREVHGENADEYLLAHVESGTFDDGRATSRVIDGLIQDRNAARKRAGVDRALFAPAAPAHAAPGFYVHGDTAYKVQTNRAGDRTYAKRWTGTAWDYAPGAGRLLAAMVPMTAEQAAALGLASGKCINCLQTLGGETLSARVSALIGYGETCAAHNGWAYPKGAAAQREFIAARA